MYSQPSKSSCGGYVLYVNSRLDHHVRDDISVTEHGYETIWIEINKHKSKSLLYCCLNRHPSSNITNFKNHTLNPFIIQMVSQYLLPRILHPTGEADRSATIIDDIFFNTLEFDCLSGNLLTKASDYFPRFLIMKNVAGDYAVVLLSSMTTPNLVNSYL